MPKYDVFGYALDSEIELPELTPSTAERTSFWRIHTTPDASPGGASSFLGSETVYGTVQARAYSVDAGFRLVFDDTGTFEVRVNDRIIAWHPGSNANQVAVRADLLGRVLALAAHADGLIALHASAVAIGGRAIAFLGPKHAGKSTLALALVRHGAKLLTDDTLVIRMPNNASAAAAPGVQRVRLWNDSARALGAQWSGDEGAKPMLDRLTSAEVESASVPLAACYVLEPTTRPTVALVERERLSAVHAAVACVRFSKLGALAGGTAGTTVLDRAVRLTRVVPLFMARVQRDLGALDGVARGIMRWHEADA